MERGAGVGGLRYWDVKVWDCESGMERKWRSLELICRSITTRERDVSIVPVRLTKGMKGRGCFSSKRRYTGLPLCCPPAVAVFRTSETRRISFVGPRKKVVARIAKKKAGVRLRICSQKGTFTFFAPVMFASSGGGRVKRAMLVPARRKRVPST